MGDFLSTILSSAWATIKTFEFKDAIDIIAVAIILYYLLRLLRQSRVGQLLKGVVILLVAYGLSAIFNLTMMNYILKALFEFAIIILVVVFQPELRQVLEKLGHNKTLKSIVTPTNNIPVDKTAKAIGDVADTCALFSKTKTGALIVFERESILNDTANTGTYLNSDTSVALFGNIFFNKAPLHDGAVIIRDGEILSAGCILPLTKTNDINSELGTRHRAALGMSEDSDAVCVVVSEENGVISLAVGGRLIRNLDRDSLYEKLSALLIDGDTDNQSLLSVLFKSRKEKKDEE
ncbi:MAG: diadenylate cyclase CdaA [Ruminococcus sp.]|nr:diadenylate cyclase CdaA [Ruminococcus sp.]